MPWGDGTGPMGRGPMTGRGAGYCAGLGMPGYMNPVPGRGFRGRGRGWGWRHGFHATGLMGWQGAGLVGPVWGMPYAYGAPVTPAMNREQEIETLKGQMEYFEDALDGIRKRIAELQSKPSEA